jgi:CheY-like chemotaxis protein
MTQDLSRPQRPCHARNGHEIDGIPRIRSTGQPAPSPDALSVVTESWWCMAGTQSAPLRLLAVDDLAVMRHFVRAVISRSSSPAFRDASVAEASDLAQARARLAEETFDVVVLDVSLPDGSGLDLARDLSENPPGAGRPIVIATSGDGSVRSAAFRAGCAGFIMKPYTPAALITTLTEYWPIPRAETGAE